LTAIECSVGANPPSAVAVMKWARPWQPLTALPDWLQQELARTFRKWSSRWQKQLPLEDLPPLIQEALAPKLAKPTESADQSGPAARPQESAREPRQPPTHQQRHYPAKSVDSGRPDKRSEKTQAPPQKAIPEVAELLRHLQSHFNDLRDELETARKRLERTQPIPKPKEPHPIEAGRELTKLRDENAQLNETITQLRETLSELANDNFNEAISRKVDTDQPITDPVEQYKSLLTLRIREQIVNFQILNPEHRSDGLPLLLDNIFRTLQESGIDLTNIEPPSPPIRRRY
jgi:hypothetical protein